MDNILRKKRIRRIALAALAAICVIGGMLALNVERADYRAILGNAVADAENLLREAETGYEKGQ